VLKQRKVNWRAHLAGVSSGLVTLVASHTFPKQKSSIQVASVTILVSYLSIGDVWASRREPDFRIGLLLGGVLHVCVWAGLWRFLPVHILNLVMIAGVEGIALLVIVNVLSARQSLPLRSLAQQNYFPPPNSFNPKLFPALPPHAFRFTSRRLV